MLPLLIGFSQKNRPFYGSLHMRKGKSEGIWERGSLPFSLFPFALSSPFPSRFHFSLRPAGGNPSGKNRLKISGEANLERDLLKNNREKFMYSSAKRRILFLTFLYCGQALTHTI